jgi:lipooligosaccharide transport system ATP-binding protein
MTPQQPNATPPQPSAATGIRTLPSADGSEADAPVATPVVEARGLVKHYGAFEAVRGIDLRIEAGECFGLLGPNGSGKTTTVRMIQAVSPVTAGALRVFGMDVARQPREIKAAIGVCPQESNLDGDFSVERNLLVFARYFGIARDEARRRADELIEFFHLADKRDQKIDNLSGGLKRRLQIARALINRPRLLILDEPTTGLDPQARHQIWNAVRDLRRRGLTSLLTTHFMDEAEMLCDRLVIMDAGRIIEEGSPRGLIDRHVGQEVIEIEDPPAELEAWLTERAIGHELHSERAHIHARDARGLLDEITGRGWAERFILRRATLEDVFLKLTGRGLRD